MRLKIDEMIYRKNESRIKGTPKLSMKGFARLCYKNQTDNFMSYYNYVRALNDDRAEFVRVHDLFNFAFVLGCDINDLTGFPKQSKRTVKISI
jgi:hypothetical protein